MLRLVTVFLLMVCLLPIAAVAEGGDSFDSLPAPMRQVLSPFEKEWGALDEATRGRLLRGAERWNQLSTEERAAAAKRMAWWRSLPAERQAQIRRSFESFKALPPDQQRRIRQTFKRFQNLPIEQRLALLKRFEGMSDSEREAFMLGARAKGAGIPWRQLWGPIPRDEIRALVAMTQGLDQPLKLKLAELLKRTPEAERQGLRKRLLAMGFAEREAFLRAQ